MPITLQTLFTYLAGATLGGRLGALSQLLYVLLGVAGLPVFGGGRAGAATLIGPTGGYLIGFIPAAFAVGELAKAEKNPSFQWLLFCMGLGTLIIYTLGALQLMMWMRVSLHQALVAGVLPFIPGDSLKALAAAQIARRIRTIATNRL